MLKKIGLSFLVLTQLAVSAVTNAATHDDHNMTGYNPNPTYIHNTTINNLVYQIHGSTIFNKVYKVQKESVDIYHAGYGDDVASIRVGSCLDSSTSDNCNKHTHLINCDHLHYDINQVSDITIMPGMFCIVKCRDGSTTSCQH